MLVLKGQTELEGKIEKNKTRLENTNRIQLDINTRIGLIELFFKGNSIELTECLVKLNKLSDKEECVKVIDKFAETFGVDKKEEIYKQFVNLVDRKLNS